ncbi:MAG TPA: LD-carboxypeptidase [Terracidiphilus sp.]|nr:LD-carboxypeptidase [Terracidiphilus sp.]
MTAVLKPKAVPHDALVAVVSPASTPQPDRVELGLEALRALGYSPQPADHILTRGPLYFAGTPEMRLRDLHHAFADDEVRAVFSTRGGYGSAYLLGALDLDLISESSKPFLGYSDLTALQLWLLDQVQLPAFHGPMLSADFARENGVHLPSLQAALGGQTYSLGAAEGLRTLHPGRARGTLYGGCLSVLVALLGTPYEPQTEGKLLFLEDVNARPYQIDRMLWQLAQAGKLDGVRGIVFGEMLDCSSPGAPPELLDEVILRVFDQFQGPIAIGLRSGHVSHSNVTLTFGVEAELHAANQADLHLLQPAVIL